MLFLVLDERGELPEEGCHLCVVGDFDGVFEFQPPPVLVFVRQRHVVWVFEQGAPVLDGLWLSFGLEVKKIVTFYKQLREN